MNCRTRRYKEGLGGKKPGFIWIDEKGHRAQAAGYRDHLRNQDLADRLRQRAEPSDSYSYEDYGDSTPVTPRPTRLHHRIIKFIFGVLLTGLGFGLSHQIAIASTESDHSPYWWSFVIGIVVTSILWLPGFKLIGSSFKRNQPK